MIVDPSTLGLDKLEQDNGLPAGLLNAVGHQESGWDNSARSPAGAEGLFQFMPPTAKQYGIDPNDPQQAAQGAARMYGELYKKYNGDVDKTLAAYNWGQGNVDKYGLEKAPKETRDYISRITSAMGNAPVQQQVAAADQGSAPKQPPSGFDKAMNALGEMIIPSAHAETMDDDPDAFLQDVYGSPNKQPDIQPQSSAPDEADTFLNDVYGGEQQPRSFGQNMVRQLGLTGRHLIEGAASLPLMVGDAANSGINLATGAINNATGTKIPAMQMPSQVTSDLLTQAGVPSPENPTERVVGDISQALAGVGGGSGIAKIAGKAAPFLNGLGDQIGTQASSAIGSAASSGIARENGASPAVQTIAGLAGGVAGGLRGMTKEAGVTSNDLKQKAGASYDEASRNNHNVAPSFLDDLISYAEQNIGPKGRGGKSTAGEDAFTAVLDRWKKDMSGTPLTLHDIQGMDEGLGAHIDAHFDKINGLDAVGQKLLSLQNELRDSVDRLPADQVTGGKQGFDALKKARALWSQAAKVRDIERIVSTASPDNAATSMRNKFLALANNSSRMRGYTTEQQKMIRQASKAGVSGEFMRGIGSRLISIIGLSHGNLPGAAAAHFTSMAARGAAEANQTARAQKIIDNITGVKSGKLTYPTTGAAMGAMQGLNAGNKDAQKLDIERLRKLPTITIPSSNQ